MFGSNVDFVEVVDLTVPNNAREYLVEREILRTWRSGRRESQQQRDHS